MASGLIDVGHRAWQTPRWVRQVIAVLLLLLVWQGSVWLLYGTSTEGRLLPSPIDVMAAFRQLLVSGELLRNSALSLLRVLAGLVVAMGIAIPLGLAIG